MEEKIDFAKVPYQYSMCLNRQCPQAGTCLRQLTLDNSKQLKFTVSLGVSQVNILVDKNIEDCIKRSDDALYEAKDLGKNRVCVIK